MQGGFVGWGRYVGKKIICYWIFNLRGCFWGFWGIRGVFWGFICYYVFGIHLYAVADALKSVPTGHKKIISWGAADDCSIYTLYFRLYTVEGPTGITFLLR